MKTVVRQVNKTAESSSQRWFTARVLFEVGEENLLFKIYEGKILSVERGVNWSQSWDFALRWSADHWKAFLGRKPLHNDVFACIRRGYLKLEGNSELAMMNISSLSVLLESMRGQER